jgi:hypothetical protein
VLIGNLELGAGSFLHTCHVVHACQRMQVMFCMHQNQNEGLQSEPGGTEGRLGCMMCLLRCF